MTTNVPTYLQKYLASTDSASKDADAMASASVSVPRVSLKGKKFMFINGEEQSKKTDEIFVTILAVDPEGSRMVKTFYANGYNPNDTAPPDCSSADGIRPDAWVQSPVSEACGRCSKNVFGSAISPSGKKTKACRDSKRLWIAKPEEVEETVYGLNVPVTSLKNMAAYGNEIRQLGVPIPAVLTRIYMDEDSEFPVLHFENAGFLDEETGGKALERNASKDWMASIPSGPALADNSQTRTADKLPNKVEAGEEKAASATSEDIDKAAQGW